jgi:Xaa-Pro aminopeptidase
VGSLDVPVRGPGARTDLAAQWLGERELDALLVTHPVNLRYLAGFTGSNGLAVIGEPDLGLRLFLTDFRYVTQAAEQVDASYEREVASNELLEGLAGALVPERLGRPRLRLGFDDAHLSVKSYERLRGLVAEGVEMVPAGGLVERLRAVKDPDEVARIRAAAALADEVLGWVVERSLVGRTERDVAIELEHELRLRGATAPSFPSIVAAGEHSALPHAEPRDVAIAAGTFVTIDMGALLDGYCSDVTRTFATGRLDADARAVYDLVLEAQRTGLSALRPGPTGREVDAAAREVIAAAGHGEHYGHGLGHGVGLEVHEGPRLSRTGATVSLEAGHVVTVEPGVYLPGRFGVRIEDLVVVVPGGNEVLSSVPKELTEVG